MMIEGGCEGKPVAQCDAPVHSPFVAKSSFVGGPLSPQRWSTHRCQAVDIVARPCCPGRAAGIVFDGYGGAINRIGSDRDGLRAPLGRGLRPVLDHLRHARRRSPTAVSRGAGLALAPALGRSRRSTPGSYQNYIDPTLADWQQAYYGANLPRLRQIKGRHDPDDVFHFAQSIPLPA